MRARVGLLCHFICHDKPPTGRQQGPIYPHIHVHTSQAIVRRKNACHPVTSSHSRYGFTRLRVVLLAVSAAQCKVSSGVEGPEAFTARPSRVCLLLPLQSSSAPLLRMVHIRLLRVRIRRHALGPVVENCSAAPGRHGMLARSRPHGKAL